MSKLHAAPIHIDDGAALTALEVRARARRIRRQHSKLGLVVVDYLQLMASPSRGENRATEISEISRSLKGLAKELDCPVILLSQLNRDVEKRVGRRPMMSDLRESGAIEQDADTILFLYREEVYDQDCEERLKGVAEVIIGKQRNGPIGKVMPHLPRPLHALRRTTRRRMAPTSRRARRRPKVRNFNDYKRWQAHRATRRVTGTGDGGSSIMESTSGCATWKRSGWLTGIVSAEKRSKNKDVAIVSRESPKVADVAHADADADAGKASTAIAVEGSDGVAAIPECPHEKLIALYHDLLPACPRVEKWTPKRRQAMRSRWRDEAKPNREKHRGYRTLEEGLAYWRRFFAYCAESKFLTGRAPGRDGKPPFVASLAWLTKEENFVKAIEGTYHRDL
jgi:hypothetical protein